MNQEGTGKESACTTMVMRRSHKADGWQLALGVLVSLSRGLLVCR